MSASPHANGGGLLRPLAMPDMRDYAVAVDAPGDATASATTVLGGFLRDVMALNAAHRNFRIMGPDETASNRLQAVFDVTARAWDAEILPTDDHLAPGGRVMEVLSEHLCQGWLEGYLLTGRHGVFNCYEAFIHIIDSMFNQHAKWLKTSREIPWRRPIASLNYLLTSHVWRQDHNGFSHQDPGFIDHVVNKKAEIVRVYLPPDANTLLSVADHCLRSRQYVNVIVAGKQPAPQWLTMDEAILHCTRGVGIWPWASTGGGNGDPDVVLACAGDVPTLETLAAARLLNEHLPDLAVRVVNVVNLMRLQPTSEHPHGHVRPGVRRRVHHRQARRLRLPRLPVAHPPPDVPADEPRQRARARLQGGGDDDDALRHGDDERPRPVPPGHRRHRPGAGARAARGRAAPGDGRPAPRVPRLDPRDGRGPPRRGGVALEPRAGGPDVSPAAGDRPAGPRADPDSRWVIREDRLDLARLGFAESVFALSNGHLGLRGNLDEGEPRAIGGTYLNGFHETLPLGYGERGYGYPEDGQTVVNVTDGKLIRLLIEDEPLDVTRGELEHHERTLDMRTGILERRLLWTTRAGRAVRVTSRRLVSLRMRSVAAISYEVEAVNRPVRVALQSNLLANRIDATEETDPRRAAALGAVLVPRLNVHEGLRVVLAHTTRRSGLSLAAGMEHAIECEVEPLTLTACEPDLGRLTVSALLHPERPLRMTKLLAYHWSAHQSIEWLRDQVDASLQNALAEGWEGLAAMQCEHLDGYWRNAKLELDGDPELERALRFAQFQLVQAATRADGRAIPAKGLTGPGYDGHAFWDTEGYVLPVLAYSQPAWPATRCAGATPSSTWRATAPASWGCAAPCSRGGRSGARSAPATGPRGPPPSTSTPTSRAPSSSTWT